MMADASFNKKNIFSNFVSHGGGGDDGSGVAVAPLSIQSKRITFWKERHSIRFRRLLLLLLLPSLSLSLSHKQNLISIQHLSPHNCDRLRHFDEGPLKDETTIFHGGELIGVCVFTIRNNYNNNHNNNQRNKERWNESNLKETGRWHTHTHTRHIMFNYIKEKVIIR